MIKGDKEYLDQIALTQVCPEHDNKLCVAWHAGENCYVIRCGAGHFPEEVTRLKTPLQEHQAGEREAHAPLTSLLPRADLATGELLAAEMIQGLIGYARKYQLDPFRGHVVMMYGKPYFTIDAYLYHAKQSKISYQLKSRPASDAERKSIDIGEGDHAWLAEVVFTESGGSFVGLGIVTREEMEAKSPRDAKKLRSPVVAAHPWQLAQKRAEWQALRRAFPIGESEEKADN